MNLKAQLGIPWLAGVVRGWNVNDECFDCRFNLVESVLRVGCSIILRIGTNKKNV